MRICFKIEQKLQYNNRDKKTISLAELSRLMTDISFIDKGKISAVTGLSILTLRKKVSQVNNNKLCSSPK